MHEVLRHIRRKGFLMLNIKIKKYIIVTMLLVAMVLSLFPSMAMADQGEDTLIIAIHRDENTLTPYTYVTGYPGIEVMRLIYDSLFAYDKNNLPIPWMVKDYTIDDQYKVYTMELKEGLKWHDSSPVTADDVKFSFEYALNQQSARWKNIAGMVSEIEVQDPLNFSMVLTEPNPDFLKKGLADFPIIPKHIYKNMERADEVQEVIGSGPYRMVDYKAGQYYKLEAMEDYFMGTPLVKNLSMPIMTDTGAIFQALKAGQIHGTTAHLAPELVDTFSADNRIKIITGTGLTTTLLQINNEVYPLSEAQFRKAIALAIDTKDLVDTVLLGYGDRGSLGFSNPNLPWGIKDLVFDADIQKSNELLDGLGFTQRNQDGIRLDKEGKPLEFEVLVYANNPGRIRTAEVIAQHLRKVGIDLKVSSLESGTLDDKVWPGFDVTQGRDYQMAIWGWSASGQMHPDGLVDLFYSDLTKATLNIGAFSDPVFDGLVDKLKATLDEGERLDIIKEMQQVLADKVPVIPLYYPQVVAAYDKNAYDRWVLVDGVGIINKFSFLPGDWQAADNSGQDQEDSQSTDPAQSTTDNQSDNTVGDAAGQRNTGLWWLVAIPAVAVVIILIRIKYLKNKR
jgi:peptide/nickel transport system substrate-binding protein